MVGGECTRHLSSSFSAEGDGGKKPWHSDRESFFGEKPAIFRATTPGVGEEKGAKKRCPRQCEKISGYHAPRADLAPRTERKEGRHSFPSFSRDAPLRGPAPPAPGNRDVQARFEPPPTPKPPSLTARCAVE